MPRPDLQPKKWFSLPVALILLMVLLDAGAFWVADTFVNPRATPWERVFFRPGGDYTYFPYITALAHGQLGQAPDAEARGQGEWTLPIPQFVPFAVLVKLLGPWGFLAADLLLQTLRWWLLYQILLLVRLGRETAMGVAALISLSLYFGVWVGEHHVYGNALTLDRISRPLVTDPIILGLFWCLLAAVLSPKGKLPLPALLGAAALTGLVPNGDVHSFFYAGPLYGLTFLWLAWRERDQWKTAFPRLVLSAVPLLLLLAYLVLHTSRLHPDVSPRLGMFPLSILRFPGPTDFYSIPINLFWLGCVAALGAGAYVLRLGLGQPAQVDSRRMLICAGVAMALIYLAPWICILLLGKTLQTYQFGERVCFSGYYITTLGLAVLGRAYHASKPGWALWAKLRWAPLLLCLLPLGVTVSDARKGAKSQIHPRRNIFPYNQLRSYRRDLEELERFLATPRGQGFRTLATLDTVMHSWWSVARQGDVYLLAPFTTNVPDREVEDRLLRFMNMCGVQDYSYLFEMATLGEFHSQAKYQLSPAYHYAPEADYGGKMADLLKGVKFYQSWNLAPPIPEVARIEQRRLELRGESFTNVPYDLIILNTPQPKYNPDPRYFEEVLRNRSFKVYAKRAIPLP